MLDPTVYERKDYWYEEAQSLNKRLEEKDTALRKAKSENRKLQNKNIDLSDELESQQIDLSEYQSTPRYPTINGIVNLTNYLDLPAEKKAVRKWIKENMSTEDYSALMDADNPDRDTLIINLRKWYHKFHGKEDPHNPEKRTDNWQLPRELIRNNFEGDCEDNMFFIKYMYDVLCEDIGNKGWKEGLFCAFGAKLTERGWTGANHAYLVYGHSDGNYYVLESAVWKNSEAIQRSIERFGNTPIQSDREHPAPTTMWNKKMAFTNPFL